MARAARTVLIDYPLHVVQRGINRGQCFFADADYRTYLRYLASFSARFGCSVHAYCLMTNHVHLLLRPHAADSCALLMKNLGQCYVQGVNRRLVAAPAQYPWSSYGANAEGRRDGLLRSHAAYESLGLETGQRSRTYKAMCEESVPDLVVDEIRKATRAGYVLGKRRRNRGRPSNAR